MPDSPTMPTATEAEADSPQNPEEELPAGNPNLDSPLRPEEESPTMPTTTEAEADSYWNPEEKSPAGNLNARFTNYANCTEAEADSPWNPEDHQQETLMPDSPYRPEEESPTLLTAAEALNFNHFKANLHYIFFNND